MKPIKTHIRWMIRRDMAEVMQIEHASFEFPWFESDFIKCLRQRNCIGMVAEHRERIVGFMLYDLHKTRLDLLNIAVDPRWRRRGVGRQMVLKMVSKLNQRRTKITTEVRETNLAAQFFFKKQGFTAVRVHPDYYEDGPEESMIAFERQGRPDDLHAISRMYRGVPRN